MSCDGADVLAEAVIRAGGINLSQESNRVTVGVRGLAENTSDRGQSRRCIAVHPVTRRCARARVDACVGAEGRCNNGGGELARR